MATRTHAQASLESLVEGFDHDAANSRSLIRELLERDALWFQDAVVPILKASNSSRGAQFILGLLVASNRLVPILCNPALTLAEAVDLARMAVQLDPLTHFDLDKSLADGAAQGETAQQAGRLMDILSKISTGNRVAPSLMRLLQNPDPQMRSKAVLLIGRSKQSVEWVQDRMAEADPRIRANAVEALWGLDNAEAKELLRSASRDANNRVAGNAVIALYRIGDEWAIPEMLRMAGSESALFRSSAAWAMGETGDPRFSETLGRLVGEANAIVRKRAFAALSRLKAAAAKARQGGQWRVAGHFLPASGEQRQLRLEVGSMDGSEPPRLLPTQFILSVDGQPVTEYLVETRPPAETLAVTFLLPYSADSGKPPWIQGSLDCLPWKRPADLWCADFYTSTGDRSEDPSQFVTDSEAATAALQNACAKTEWPSFWDGMLKAVHTRLPAPGARHLIVYSQSTVEAPPEMVEITSSAMSAKISVHAISLAPNPPLEELCRRTQGSFHLAQSELETARLIKEEHFDLLARFLISCQPAPGARELSVRIFDSTGWGEMAIPLPA